MTSLKLIDADGCDRGPTIVLAVSSGWGVRTFLRTDALRVLSSGARVVVLTSEGLVDGLRQTCDGSVAVEALHAFDQRAGLFGTVFKWHNRHFAHLSATGTRRANRSWHLSSGAWTWLGRLREAWLDVDARLFASERSTARFQHVEARLLRRKTRIFGYYRDLFARYRPSLLVSTVPYESLEVPPVLVAQSLGIATACWTASWDNATSKPPHVARFDRYLVWSERMRLDLERNYPETTGRPIDVVGVPHFDWYRDDGYLLGREDFCSQIGFDAARPIILYATATPRLAPTEHLVVKQLHADFQKIDRSRRPQLLVRLHPSDPGERFDGWEGDDLFVQVPGRNGDGRLDRYCPTRQDIVALVNAVRHAGVVVNIASSITLDASVCDRPVVNVAFDPGEDGSQQKRFDAYYTVFDHYRTVLQHGAVRIARSREELVEHVACYLADPGLDRAGRRALCEVWCGVLDGTAGRRAGEALLRAAGVDVSPRASASQAATRPGSGVG